MKIRCTEEEILIFHKISDAASELSMAAFIIGGFVRDKILNRDTKDADIVCDGDGIQLAQFVASQFSPKPILNVFKNFGTAQLKIFLNENNFMGKEGQVVPEMSEEWISIIRNRYIELYEKLIGEKFIPENLSNEETNERILQSLNRLKNQ